MLPIDKFISVKLATLVLALYFINGVDCEAWLKVICMASVASIFIIAKTIQNIKLKDKETG